VLRACEVTFGTRECDQSDSFRGRLGPGHGTGGLKGTFRWLARAAIVIIFLLSLGIDKLGSQNDRWILSKCRVPMKQMTNEIEQHR
jgi:hypothetical protein